MFTYPATAYFRHMQSDAYPTPTIAVWHLRQQLETKTDSPAMASSSTETNCLQDINQLIAAAETLAADLNPAQINYVWHSCESIYRQTTGK